MSRNSETDKGVMCYSIEIIQEDVDFYINIPDLSLWNTQFKNPIYFKYLLELWNQFLVTDLFQTPDKCDSWKDVIRISRKKM